MLKKNLPLLLISLIIFATSDIFAQEAQHDPCNHIITINAVYGDTAYRLATGLLTKYYYAIDQAEDVDLTDEIGSDALLQYINRKIDTLSYKLNVYGKQDKQNYKLRFQLLEREVYDDFMKLTVLVQAEFNYRNAEIDSAFTETAQLLIAHGTDGLKVEDWYIFEDYYDTAVRGELTGLSDLTYWDKPYKVTNQQQNLDDAIKAYYDHLLTDAHETVTDARDVRAQANLYSLNRNNMVAWANDNYNRIAPVSGNTALVRTYYDFAQISGNYDCTNFVSHAILAGGAPLYNDGGRLNETGWYYVGIANRSSSWTGVENLYRFLTRNRVKGPVGTHLDYTIFYYSGTVPYSAGDIIQFHNGFIWRHSGLITGHVPLSGNVAVYEALVTHRGSAGSAKKNQRASEIYTGYDKRVIKLSGYYN